MPHEEEQGLSFGCDQLFCNGQCVSVLKKQTKMHLPKVESLPRALIKFFSLVSLRGEAHHSAKVAKIGYISADLRDEVGFLPIRTWFMRAVATVPVLPQGDVSGFCNFHIRG